MAVSAASALHEVPLNRSRIRPGRIVAWTLLFIGGLLMVTPLLYMFSTSLKSSAQIYDMRLIPLKPTLDNYVGALTDGGFLRWFVNSTVIATLVTCSNVFFDSLVGYTLAKFQFRGPAGRLPRDPLHADDPDRDAGHPVVSDGEASCTGSTATGASCFPA